MKKKVTLIAILFILFLSGCSSQYNEDDVIASFQGNDIYVKDLRKLFHVGDTYIPEVARNYVFQEAVILEAKELGLEVPKEDVDREVESFMTYLEEEAPRETKEFFEGKAGEYSMSVEEYVDTIVREEIEKSMYVEMMEVEAVENQAPDELNAIERRDWVEEHFDEWYQSILEKYEDDIEYFFEN
ncbi:hypothetical protein [Evansella tamaricis]|uniref:Uncharacterized protein n=1 Tax=Evansella tamaricis TaxID=2069301 RepID=A0ABS6JCM0_9BACI|nr:hypothetical protein [Evansella tamaricis]MBU9711424.1 hypothetical protein [Evansella tamaricis]